MIVWETEFPGSFRVPYEIVKLALADIVEDMSWRQDPCPSFGAKLKDKNWVRLWVEHPDPTRRHGWPNRYTVVVQPEPTVPFGWRMVATEDLGEALMWMTEILKAKGPRWRFKVLESEVVVA